MAGLDKVKKLVADLTHKEAERVHVSRECESLKVRALAAQQESNEK